jgi:hypothetical protein
MKETYTVLSAVSTYVFKIYKVVKSFTARLVQLS